MQLRAQVYAGLIHGATGIIYFCWDTYVCRDGHVIGMSPDPQVQYLEPGPGKPKPSPARPMDLAAPHRVRTAKSTGLLGRSTQDTHHPFVCRISDSAH